MANEKELTELYSGPGAESFRVFEDENGRVRATMGPGEIITAIPSGSGLEIQDGSDTRSFLTAGMSGGVPTGNFM